jgi:glycosyltransferase involved in cell wall biosynthesis
MKKPLVSIVLATMHRPHYLIATLQSIQRQEVINWECIVVLEYNHQPTVELMEQFVGEDKRFSYYIKPKSAGTGLSNSRNFGLTKIAGDFVQFFDDDDIMLPFHLEMKLRLFEKHPTADFVVCKLGGFRGEYQGKSDDPPFYGCEGYLEQTHIDDFFTKDYKINSCAGMMKKQVFEKVQWATEISCENDLEFYIHVLAKGFVGYETSRVGYHYRQHPDSMTGNFFAGDAEMRASQIAARMAIISLLAKEGCLSHAVVRSNLILAMKLNCLELKQFILEQAKDQLPNFTWSALQEWNFKTVGSLYRKTGKGLRFLWF